jgi:pyruvate dehydrogenase E1 component
MSYREDKKGQMLEEGINEAGSVCSWIAAATSYANHGIGMIPFYIYYSMFGFQRVGDFIWAAGDMRARGFLLGGTAGRTTLAGEGLQHQDGHSQLLATTVPNCRAYDPTYAYELAVIIQDGMKRMYGEGESVFYYISLMNENYAQPAMPEGVASGILRGGYRVRAAGGGAVAAVVAKEAKSKSEAKSETKPDSKSGGKTAAKSTAGVLRATLLGSGTILREVLAAADLLQQHFGVASDVYSITSFSELRREALACERANLLNPEEPARVPYVQTLFAAAGGGAIVAATDYMRTVADQVRQWLPPHYVTLGTDGFGRSDARAELRQHFEVDRRFVALATLKSLVELGSLPRSVLPEAIAKLGIDTSKSDPLNS